MNRMVFTKRLFLFLPLCRRFSLYGKFGRKKRIGADGIGLFFPLPLEVLAAYVAVGLEDTQRREPPFLPSTFALA